MIITREALVKSRACKDGLEFFDEHFPAGEATQEVVFSAIAKYAPTTSWQAWLARKLRLTATCQILYSDGQPRAEETYVEGNLHGQRRTWYSDGNPCEEETYVDGKLHGQRRTWHPDGQPCEEETYVDCNLHGLRRTWWADGKLCEEENYVEGKLHGLCRYWYSDAGKPCEEETWDHGVRISSVYGGSR